MKLLIWFAVVVAVAANDRTGSPRTAVEVIGDAFETCLKEGSISSLKPKFLKFLSASLKDDRILITDDLVIEGDKKFSPDSEGFDTPVPERYGLSKKDRLRFLMLEKIDNFLNSHKLKIKLPKELVTGEIFPFAPKNLFDNMPKEVNVPLTEVEDVNTSTGRGLMKKVIVPFLLGLKLKATTFIPLAVALIALKTWKALTLGLLSMVLSAAMVIFKFAKPKVINYEVYHYPNHHPAPIPVEHSYLEHGYGRSETGQSLAYLAHRK